MNDLNEEQRGWRSGVLDSIKQIKTRQAHYELYRCTCDYHGPGDIHADWCPGKEMRTHPATFAVLDEILMMLEAMLERGTYKATSVLLGSTDAG